VILNRKAGLVAGACLVAVMFWPTEAAAQHAVARARPVRTAHSSTVVVGGGFYSPFYYRPYYYDPFWFGFGYGAFYPALYAGWYPYYAAYGQYGYPGPYQYPYRYGGAYYSWSSAHLEMKPKEAQVYVDGYFVGVVDQFDGVFQRLDVPAGEHELSVYLPGFHTWSERALFRPGQNVTFKGTLEPMPAGAPPEPRPQPSPNAAPPNGGGQYGGGQYGNPPYEGPRRAMPPPDRGVRAREENTGGFGTLNIRVQPEDATVIIDGQRWDSPDGGSRLSVQLSGGSHRIEVHKDGFKPYTTTIQIRGGDQQSLNISLPQQGN
jgi:hypothetical protein